MKSGMYKLPERAGMFESEQKDRCLDPDHEFPTHLSIPPGSGYRHVCPSCGAAKVVTNPVTFHPSH